MAGAKSIGRLLKKTPMPTPIALSFAEGCAPSPHREARREYKMDWWSNGILEYWVFNPSLW